jgi:hypothetical protein
MTSRYLLAALALATAASGLTQAAPSGSAFNYQGALTRQDGSPADGTFEFRCTVYDAATEGQIVAGPVINSPVVVNHGLLQMDLDFGRALWKGVKTTYVHYFLGLGLRPFGSPEDFIELLPRQPLRPAPYAFHAVSSGGLTDPLSAEMLQGTYSGAVTFNNASNQFAGDGSGLFSLNASRLNTGTVPDGRLSGNVAFLTGSPTFAGTVSASGFTGGGAGLTGLNANNLSAGTVPDGRLSGNVALLTGSPTFAGTVSATGFTGSGAGLTGLNASNLTSGTVPDGRLSPNVSLLDRSATFQGPVEAVGDLRASGDLLAGRLNVGPGHVLDGPFGVIAGGKDNTVTAPFGAILSGEGNFVGSAHSVICGGLGNIDTADWGFTGGGWSNYQGGHYSVLVGGATNTIHTNAYYCSLLGGGSNYIGTNCYFSVLGGGRDNTNQANADYTVTGGGFRNLVQTNADYSLIAGGRNNTIRENADSTVIGGGANNVIQPNAARSLIAGGRDNTVQTDADHAVIGGGGYNIIQANADRSLIAGGAYNMIQPLTDCAVIAGGTNNTIQANSDYAAVGGGSMNLVFTNVAYATIPGGGYAAATNYGQQAYASGTFPGASAGSAQASLFVVRGTNVTDQTLTIDLYLDGAGQKIKLRPDSTWAFEALVTGRTSTGDAAGFRLQGVIEHELTGAAPGTRIIGGVDTTMVGKWEGAMTGVAAVSAVADPGALVIRVTTPGPARWVGTVRTAEVIY